MILYGCPLDNMQFFFFCGSLKCGEFIVLCRTLRAADLCSLRRHDFLCTAVLVRVGFWYISDVNFVDYYI